MKLGYVETDAGVGFAVERGGGGWVHLRDLGIEAVDTASAIEGLAGLDLGSANGPRGLPAKALLCPVRRPSKIVAVGLNYADHAAETGKAAPTVPRLFGKFTNALSGPFDPIPLDPGVTEKLDYEAELAVVVGRRVRDVSPAEALSCVFGYAVANDVTARDHQRRDGEPGRAKGFDGFGPVGPWITTADEVPDPQRLAISSTVNGETRQSASTAQMIHGVAEVISFLARGTTLEPGDTILTGTPAGVGNGLKPPRYLAAGDVVTCEVEGLGRLENRVAAV